MSEREIDERIAVEVMGWRRGSRTIGGSLNRRVIPAWFHDRRQLPWDVDQWSPSDYIECAWLVVEKMRERGWYPTIYYSLEHQQWVCELRHINRAFDADGHWLGGGATLQEAICKVALKAQPHTPDSSVKSKTGAGGD